MSTIADLKELREKMIERLTKIPEYQALKAMDKFIGEVTTLFETANDTRQELSAEKTTSAPLESVSKNEPTALATSRVTPYVPAQRVA
jgi:hypothetical protein